MEIKKPHILIISVDQQRADSLGCAGHPQVKTPNLDSIADSGVRFTQAYTTCPKCMPARVSFITGAYAHNHGMMNNCAYNLSVDFHTCYHMLQNQGYYTVHIGKSHYYKYSDLKQHGCSHMKEMEPYMKKLGHDYVYELPGYWGCGGFREAKGTPSYISDLWKEKGYLDKFYEDYRKRNAEPFFKTWPSVIPNEYYLDTYIGNKAAEFIDNYKNNHPFCLFVGFPGPHLPFDAPEKYVDMYNPREAPPAIPPAEKKDWNPAYIKNMLDDSVYNEDGRVRELPRQMTAKDIGLMRANYYGKITCIDDSIGKILGVCKRKNMLDNLIIVYWSDHGEMLGDHNCLEKSTFYEPSVKIPLLISWRGKIKPGIISDALIELIDVFPTVMEAAGLNRQEYAGYGKSAWPIIAGENKKHRDFVFSEIEYGKYKRYMIRNKKFKYGMADAGLGYMLFDVNNDPYEQTNLIGHPDYKEIESEMKERLLIKLASTPNSVSMRKKWKNAGQ